LVVDIGWLALPCTWYATRIWLPAAQEAVLNNATSGFAVFCAAGVLPVDTAVI
jgi:hypothetical protein